MRKQSQCIIDNQKLLYEWDIEKNELIGLLPSTTYLHSNKKVWWKCEKGHSWLMSPDGRLKSKGCPYCLNKRVLVGYNDLSSLFPYLSNEWDRSKNQIDINKVVIGSAQKIHWVCSECHNEWVSPLRSRTQRFSGCPVCAKRRGAKNRVDTIVAKNGCITDSVLLKEWNNEKNTELGLFPEKITPHSNKKAWWTCAKCGYTWEATISNRSNGRGCPVCAHQKVVAGINDLCTTHPDLAKEWDYENNGNLKPNNVSYGMGFKVAWKCPLGHSYKATILHRSSGTNCPICNSGRQTSFAEQAVYYYVKKLFPKSISRYKDIFNNGMEIDIFIPDIKYAIEYDGSYWHNTDKFEREKKKYEICKANKIKLIRIKEFEGEISTDISYHADDTFFVKENLTELEKTIQNIYFKLYSFLNPQIAPSYRWENAINTVNIERDRFKIANYLYERNESFAHEYPELALEWHDLKNENTTPYMFKSGSSFVAWWKCRTCGYEWKTSIYHRVNGTGCKECNKLRNRAETHYKSRKIYQYTKEGAFVREWGSISDASRTLNITRSNLGACARGSRNVASGYRWSYLCFESLPPIIKREVNRRGINNKPVNQLDINGNIINRFNSLNDAEAQTGINATSISKVLHGHTKTAGGYLWTKGV